MRPFPTIRSRRSSLWVVPLFLLVGLRGPCGATTVGQGDAMAPLGDVHSLAREAYVWGWPLVYLHQCRTALERVPAPGKSGGMPVAPVNELGMLGDLIDPRTTVVPCANRDVLYGFGVFDLGDDAVVLQVPDFGGRFWIYQLGDHRTDAFARVGSIHGTRPGFYLVVGPDWAGTVPTGITGVFRCPTRFAYCLPRVHVDGTESDRLAALAAVNGIAAYPLAAFDGSPRQRDWARSRWLPNLASRGRLAAGVTPESFLDSLRDVVEAVPPLPGEEALYERLHGLLVAVERSPDHRAAALEGAAEAERDIVAPMFEFRNVGRALPGYWTTVDNGASFGTDYLTRCAVAKSNVFVNASHEARYYYLDLDERGLRLDGTARYRLTFPPGSLPPARAFWSLTVYDERHALPEAKDACRIGSHGGRIAPDADGSVTIDIGPDVAAGEANTLVTPSGRFSLYLRVYWPADAARDGTWTPPPATRVERIPPGQRERVSDPSFVAAPSPDGAVAVSARDRDPAVTTSVPQRGDGVHVGRGHGDRRGRFVVARSRRQDRWSSSATTTH